MAWLLARIVWSAVRYPRGYWSAVFQDMHDTIKRAWLPVSAAIFGFLVFLAILAVQFFDMVGAESLAGPLLFLVSTRSMTLWVDSMVVAGVIGAALTADIGSRKVREELEAMEVMGIDPVRELAVPRVISLTLITTMLSVPSMFVTVVSVQLGTAYIAHMPASDFYYNVYVNLSPLDVVAVVMNSLIAGLLIGTVCCYKGFVAGGGAVGLGRMVNQAVVISFVSLFVFQLAYQAVYLGLFPELGDFR